MSRSQFMAGVLAVLGLSAHEWVHRKTDQRRPCDDERFRKFFETYQQGQRCHEQNKLGNLQRPAVVQERSASQHDNGTANSTNGSRSDSVYEGNNSRPLAMLLEIRGWQDR